MDITKPAKRSEKSRWTREKSALLVEKKKKGEEEEEKWERRRGGRGQKTERLIFLCTGAI